MGGVLTFALVGRKSNRRSGALRTLGHVFHMVDADTRLLVVVAQLIGVEEGAQALGTEHLLAAILEHGETPRGPSTAVQVLTGLDVSRAAAALIGQTLRGHRPIRPLTIEEVRALDAYGLDLDALPLLPASVEAAPEPPSPRRWWRRQRPQAAPPTRPPGNLGLSGEAKRALEGMYREGLLLGDNYLGSEHLLLGILRDDDPIGTTALRLCGVNLMRARDVVVAMDRHPVQTAPDHVDADGVSTPRG